jgi:hypothetical protein
MQLARHPTTLLVRRTPGTQYLLALQTLGSELQLVPGRGADRQGGADGERQSPAQHPEQRVTDRSARLAGSGDD